MGLLDGILDAVGIGSGGMPWGSIITGGLGFLGQEDTNETNQAIAQQASAFNANQAAINRDFTAQQADKQMQFQERMSNSAWQRAVDDMQKAGINPMLAASRGMGASTPSGAMGGSSPASAVSIPVQNSASVGMATAAQAATIDNIEAQTKKTEQDTLVGVQEVITKAAQAGHLNALKDNIRQEMQSFERRMEKLGYETKTAEHATREALTRGELASWRYNLAQRITEAEIKQMEATATKLTNFATLLGLEIPAAVNAAAHQRKYPGYNIDVKPFVDDAGKAVNSAAQLFKLGRGGGGFTINNQIRK